MSSIDNKTTSTNIFQRIVDESAGIGLATYPGKTFSATSNISLDEEGVSINQSDITTAEELENFIKVLQIMLPSLKEIELLKLITKGCK